MTVGFDMHTYARTHVHTPVYLVTIIDFNMYDIFSCFYIYSRIAVVYITVMILNMLSSGMDLFYHQFLLVEDLWIK